jgi:transcription antitermination factor NusG
MSKFKVGDRVVVNGSFLEDDEHPSPEDEALVGQEGKVIEVEASSVYPIRAEIGGETCLFLEEELDPARRFKIGDRVRIVNEEWTSCFGKIGKVVDDDGADENFLPYTVEFEDGDTPIFDADDLELVSAETERKFKVGDFVRITRSGSCFEGREGKVIDDDGDDEDILPYTVELDSIGAIFNADELELVEDAKKRVEFNVGDRVHYNGAGADYLAPNIESDGTITEFADGYILVKLDKTTDAWAISPEDLTLTNTVAPTDEPTFYILWQPGYPAPPTRRFEFREDAEEVAASMARQYGRKFYVLEAVSFFAGETKVTEGSVG